MLAKGERKGEVATRLDQRPRCWFRPGAVSPMGEGSTPTVPMDSKAEQASCEAARKTGKKYSSDYTGDGPSYSSTSYMHHGVEIKNATSYHTWRDFESRHLWYRDNPLYTCVMAFDKHNVVDTMNPEESLRFVGLRNQVHFKNNLGGALVLLSRGTSRWTDALEEGDQTVFYRCADFLIYTEKINRDPDRDGPVSIWRYPEMESHMICINGDKGDAAQLLGLPMILFDDKEENLTDIIDKGHRQNVGVVVRRGEAVNRRIKRRNNRSMVINDPHAWVYWSWRFARLFPQPQDIEGPPKRRLEAGPAERSQRLHINNQLPTENLFQYRRSERVENLVRSSVIDSIPIQGENNFSTQESIDRHIECPQRSGSSSHAVSPANPTPDTLSLTPSRTHPVPSTTLTMATNPKNTKATTKTLNLPKKDWTNKHHKKNHAKELGEQAGVTLEPMPMISEAQSSFNSSGGGCTVTNNPQLATPAVAPVHDAPSAEVTALQAQVKKLEELLKSQAEEQQARNKDWWESPTDWDQRWSGSDWSGYSWWDGSASWQAGTSWADESENVAVMDEPNPVEETSPDIAPDTPAKKKDEELPPLLDLPPPCEKSDPSSEPDSATPVSTSSGSEDMDEDWVKPPAENVSSMVAAPTRTQRMAEEAIKHIHLVKEAKTYWIEQQYQPWNANEEKALERARKHRRGGKAKGESKGQVVVGGIRPGAVAPKGKGNPIPHLKSLRRNLRPES